MVDADQLFWWLVLLSLLIHGAVFVRFGDRFPLRATEYIELEVLPPASPAARDIPRPPRRQPPPEAPATPAYRPPQPAPPPPAAVSQPPAPASQDLAAPVAAPSAPTLPALGAASHQAPPAAAAPSGAVASTRDYLEMVRMRVENKKRYPDLARKRQLEGRVGVRFVIAPDGRLQQAAVVSPAAAEILNQAALAAVRAAEPFPRPPATLFSGPIPVEVSIVFELM
ncbi:MAG: TonB family protein [Desulfobacterales bacterium]